MTHTDNNIANGIVFTVLNLHCCSWRWIEPFELIEVEVDRGKAAVFKVYKWEDEDKLIAVVIPQDRR